MEKFNKLIKNVIIFFAVFIIIQYIFSSCQTPEEIPTNQAPIVVKTLKTKYSPSQPVSVEIKNNTDQIITIKNDCPSEPLDVFKYEIDKWTEKTASPTLSCENATDFTIEANSKKIITYESWNFALFSELGRYKIDLNLNINDEEKTFSSNEFTIVEEGIIKKLWNAVFYKPIYNLLVLLLGIIPGKSLGFAIIFLTLIIRTILLIPNNKAMRSQKKLQDIQPKLEEIKTKYKGDQQKISMETMALWKEAKVNPMGSCLPMLMQFPFLIALFYVIKGGLNPDNAHLLYSDSLLPNLQNINVNFLGFMNLTHDKMYALAIIIGLLQFAQIKLSTAIKDKKSDKKEKKNDMQAATSMMQYFMPVMIAVFTYSLPAGVGLYWGTSTLYGVLQQLYVNNSKEKKSEKEATVRVIKKEN